jgi:tetratricopeptide (TPR) repeat protein
MIMFEVDEYIHLAAHAASVHNHHACMSYLKEALSKQPDNPSALVLLAAQYCELGLLQRAIDGFTKALSLEPRLELARLQVGMLLLDRKRRDEAKGHFARLSGSADATLRAFADALSSAADGHAVAAREKINLALAAKAVNTALAPWMKRVADELKRQVQPIEGPDAADKIFLGAYRQLPSQP